LKTLINHFFKKNISLAAINFGSVLVSFLAQIVIAAKFGSSEERDAYFFALAIITYPILVHQNSLVATFLPNYAQSVVNGKEKEYKKLISYDFILLILISGLIFFVAEYHLLSLFIKQEKVYALLKILSFVILFQGVSQTLSAIEQAENRFILPALQNVITTVCSLGAVLVLNKIWGIDALAWGFLLGCVLHFVLLVVFGKLKNEWSLLWKINYAGHKKDIHKILRQSYWLIGVACLNKMIQPLERFFASQLGIGTVSYLGYAFQVIAVLVNIFAASIVVTSFSGLSQSWAKKETAIFASKAKYALTWVFLISIPVVGWLVVYAHDLVRLFLERGHFQTQDTLFVGETLQILSVFLATTSLNAILNKIFYIIHQGKKLFWVSTITFVFYVCFAGLAYKSYLHKGLVWAFVLESLLYSLIVHYIVFKIFKINMLYTYCKIILIALPPLIVLYTFRGTTENFWTLALKSLCYFTIFGIFAYYFIGFKPLKNYETKNFIDNSST